MDNYLLACQEGHTQIQTVIRLHFIVHQTQQHGVMIRTSATETVVTLSNGTQARQGILHHPGCIMPCSILRSSQFQILPIFTFGDMYRYRITGIPDS